MERLWNDPRAEALRLAFDRGFADAHASDSVPTEDLLLIRVCGDRYALRIADIAGVVAARTIVRLPSARPELLGAAGVRGAVVMVYDLARIAGYASSHDPVKWIALLGRDEPAGLAFHAVDRLDRAPASAIQRGAETTARHVRDVAVIDGVSHRVLDVASVRDALKL
jgi:chemotaxis signal transduction protein